MENTVVDVKSVSKRYGDRAILEELDLRLGTGDRLAIVGPSGSGKSTLLNLIGLLDRPDAGSYAFEGVETAGLGEKARAGLRSSSIGFVFQLHHLLPQLTVLENVTLPAQALEEPPSWEEVERRGRDLLEKVGLGDQVEKFPGQLSGGERQRVAVVRALINRPRLLLADEPTGALDRANANALTELLLTLNREENTALVVVTHDDAVARATGPVMRLVEGKLEAI